MKIYKNKIGFNVRRGSDRNHFYVNAVRGDQYPTLAIFYKGIMIVKGGHDFNNLSDQIRFIGDTAIINCCLGQVK